MGNKSDTTLGYHGNYIISMIQITIPLMESTALLPWIYYMGNAWITLWVLHFYHECIKWEILGLHYGYYTFTMSSLIENCTDYIMVTAFLSWMHWIGNVWMTLWLLHFND